MTISPVRTWSEVTKASEALVEVVAIIGRYLPSDSSVPPEVALSDIMRAIEANTDYRFSLLSQRGQA